MESSDEELSYDDFTRIPPENIYKKKNSKYSREGILTANKKITAVVQKYLKENPSVNSSNFNSRIIADYIGKRISGFASIKALDSLERKYQDLDTYFGYLIYHLKGEK